MFNNVFFWNLAVCENVENAARGRLQMTICRMRIACWTPNATNTLIICNAYCFSTATLVAHTHLLYYITRTLPVLLNIQQTVTPCALLWSRFNITQLWSKDNTFRPHMLKTWIALMPNGTLNDFIYRFASWKAQLVIAREYCVPERFRTGTPLWASTGKALNGRLNVNIVRVWTLNSDRS